MFGLPLVVPERAPAARRSGGRRPRAGAEKVAQGLGQAVAPEAPTVALRILGIGEGVARAVEHRPQLAHSRAQVAAAAGGIGGKAILIVANAQMQAQGEPAA